MASPYDNVPGKIFLGGISAHTTHDVVYKYFSSFGELIDCVVMQDRATGKSRGFGFVTYKDSQVTNQVLAQTHIIDGKEIDCKRAVPRDQKNEATREDASFRTKKLFVGGLTQTTTEDSFKEYFEQFGKIEDWVIMVDKVTGKSRGFGFVTFESEDSVDLVVSRYLENKVDGKWVECKKALPRDGNSASVSQSSTTTVSPSVSANSSKKTSLNNNAGEGDREIVKSLLGLRLSVDSEVEGNLPGPIYQNTQQNINQYADKTNFWETLLQQEPSGRMRNDNQGEYERRGSIYYQYQPNFQQQPSQQSYQKPQGMGSTYFVSSPQAKFGSMQEIKPQGMTTIETSKSKNSSDGFFNEVISPTNYKIPTMYKQEQEPMNYPPGLNLFDTSNQYYPIESAWIDPMTQYQKDPTINVMKGQFPTQQAQIPQKKVEKYIPLYESNTNISNI